MKVYQHVRTKNDTNGNPRRLYVEYDLSSRQAKVVGVWEEGYSDRPRHLNGAVELLTVNVEPKYYRHMVKTAKANQKYHHAS